MVTFSGSIDRRAKSGYMVDNFMAKIHRFLYDNTTGMYWDPTTAKFNYRWETFKRGAFHKVTEQREVVKRLLAQLLQSMGRGLTGC